MGRTIKLYVPVKPESGILESEIRNLTWVAGGVSTSEIVGEWWDFSENASLCVENVQVREYHLTDHGGQAAAFDAGLVRVIDELHRLGEQSVLHTSTVHEVNFG